VAPVAEVVLLAVVLEVFDALEVDVVELVVELVFDAVDVALVVEDEELETLPLPDPTEVVIGPLSIYTPLT